MPHYDIALARFPSLSPENQMHHLGICNCVNLNAKTKRKLARLNA